MKVDANNVCIYLILLVSIRASIHASKNAVNGLVWWKIYLEMRKIGVLKKNDIRG